MFTKDIIIAGINIKDILNTIIAFVMEILGKEFPEAGDIL